jgi:hypothetical protein
MWDYYAHTKGGEVVLKSNGVHADENMPLLFGNAITKDKSSQRQRRHGGQKPQFRQIATTFRQTGTCHRY